MYIRQLLCARYGKGVCVCVCVCVGVCLFQQKLFMCEGGFFPVLCDQLNEKKEKKENRKTRTP